MKVLSRQKNSKNCIICGMENPLGVKAPFYVMENETDTVASLFSFLPEHQSYPSTTHGGMISAFLDELMGRTLWVKENTAYGVTTTMNITFRKPVNYNVPLKAIGYITHNTPRWFSAKGAIYDMDNNLLAEGSARYIKLPAEKAFKDGSNEHEEICYDLPCDLTEIAFPPVKLDK